MSKRDGRKNDAGETAVMESPAVESDRSVETASSLSSTVTEVDKYPSPGKVIRKFRELRGIRQIEMAHAMGHRTAEWAGMIENGYRALDLDKAPQMAAVLQINACLLYTSKEPADRLHIRDVEKGAGHRK